MADGMSIKVEGLKELERKLLGMSPKLAKNGLRSAVAAGSRVIMAEAKKNVPVDTGTLRRAIFMKQIREASSNSKQTYFVGVRKGKGERKKNRDGWYFHFVEFGTVKMPAQPFLRPAFEAKKTDAVEVIKRRLAERVAKIAGEK